MSARTGSPELILVTSIDEAADPVPVAAALAYVAARRHADGHELGRVALCELGRERPRRPTLVSSPTARALEADLRERSLPAAARGAVCWVQGEGTSVAKEQSHVTVAVGSPEVWREWLDGDAEISAAVAVARPGAQRPLAALLAFESAREGTPFALMRPAPGLVPARRALAGIDPGGALARAAVRQLTRMLGEPLPSPSVQFPSTVDGKRTLGAGESGQALPVLLALAALIVLAGVALALIGARATANDRAQRAADLAAISAARSMRDDHSRLFLPVRGPDGSANPDHLSAREYRTRAGAAASAGIARNGFAEARSRLRIPAGPAPTRIRVEVAGRVAVAEASVGTTAAPETTAIASGGGYSGPLATRQGKGMRPDVAMAFDRMTAAAFRVGVAITITSAFRSDAEQARLFAANPDPRWVARPGTSLHRCATELDLGPPGAYAWLAANAQRFGFLKRYSWEPWHFGFIAGPEPCSAAGDRVDASRARPGDGRGSAGGGIPAFVPARFRAPIARAASRHNVPAGLLAAQLMAESNFDPSAVSSAGARGIAQFMPGTAAAYGLRDPFDAPSAIDTQARLMSDLLRQFGSTELALAAYNAGSGAVSGCRCVPPYPETQAYVARILGLLSGAGEVAPPHLEVRLLR